MAIAPGTRVGVYEVTSQLGEGGMGVVFRARDTRLLRDVALKVLPEHFADDPDRLSRFQREAQLLASLNHPNIAQIYGLEQIGNTGCIVMELVEGETLAEKLKNGPFPLEETLEIAKQIADALAAAHERGIVHRDLKPANIKVTPNGTVKVLDFGLAKALGTRASQTELSTLPTQVSGSMAGAVVGTVAYMSPEQARGKEVDARTDIWAFGCVLYEMLTARHTFEGETATDMVAKIVTADPDLNLLPQETPSSIRLLLSATLNKNLQQRLQHIGDMRLFLDPKFFPAGTTGPVAVDNRTGRRRLWAVAAFAALIGGLIPAVLYFRSTASSPAVEMRFDIQLPDTQGFLVSVSPDGQRLAYLAQSADGTRAIWFRPTASETAQKLPGTDNASVGPVWSPDSRSVAFTADGKWKKVDIASGGVQVICDAPTPFRGFTWNRQGVILFARSGDNVIARVSEGGGDVKPVTALDQAKKETVHALPVFLPDGDHFLYAIVSSMPENAGIFVGSLDGKLKQRLLPLPASNRLENMAYASPGYLLLSTGTLTAQRFDANRIALQGQPISIAEGTLFSVSNNGLLIYRKNSTATPNRQLTWFDRSGKPVGQVGTPGNYGGVEISPGGDRIAVDITANGNADIWVIDIARAVPSRITFEPSREWTAVWAPDGSRIGFASTKSDGTHIYEKASTGVGNDQLVFPSDKSEIPVDWSHDGRYIVFSRPRSGTQIYDTWLLDMSGQKKASPFIESPFDKLHARVSPDSRWIAYSTNDSGIYQIVVQSFPDPNAGRWQITAQGGVEPKWRRDGRELYYLGFDGKLMAVAIKADRGFEAGTPVPLFETPLSVNRTNPDRTRRYDVAPDGRFLMSVPVGSAASAPVTAVVNWVSGLERSESR